MEINKDNCTGCGQCLPYCPADAIFINDCGQAEINQELCYECGVCLLVECCKFDALYYPELTGGRLIRYHYNNVLAKHPVTQMTGRGTAEMKTNELTNRYKRGEVGFGIEIGRPDTGAAFKDVEKIAMALAKIGVVFEPGTPTTLLMEDLTTGKLPARILKERVICSILEFTVPVTKLTQVLQALKDAVQDIDTVFSVDMITRAEEDGSLPNVEIAKSFGIAVRPNAKTTIGLGKPGKQLKAGDSA